MAPDLFRILKRLEGCHPRNLGIWPNHPRVGNCHIVSAVQHSHSIRDDHLRSVRSLFPEMAWDLLGEICEEDLFNLKFQDIFFLGSKVKSWIYSWPCVKCVCFPIALRLWTIFFLYWSLIKLFCYLQCFTIDHYINYIYTVFFRDQGDYTISICIACLFGSISCQREWIVLLQFHSIYCFKGLT